MISAFVPRAVRLVAVVALGVLIMPTPRAEAQSTVVKPFKITGSGFGPFGLPLPGAPALPHNIVGNATHLGRHNGYGTVAVDPNPEFDFVNGRITATFGSGSPFFFFGANGDTLACNYGRTEFGASEPGTVELTILASPAPGVFLVKALFIAQFVPDPLLCTGKFAGVTGNWEMIARTEPFILGAPDSVAYSWDGSGFLTFPRPGR
jgi:hypothetical protein